MNFSQNSEEPCCLACVPGGIGTDAIGDESGGECYGCYEYGACGNGNGELENNQELRARSEDIFADANMQLVRR